MATFRVKQHDTTLPLSAETDITGATITAFIRTMGVKTEIASTVPVNVTDAVAGDFDVIVTDIAYGDFDLEVLVVKDGEEIRIPAMGYHRLLISPNLDDPLAGPYKPSATLDQVIEDKFAEQADRIIPFAAEAVEAAVDAGVFAAATEFDADRAGQSAFQSGQSASYALGHRNAAATSADVASAAAASLTTQLPAVVESFVAPNYQRLERMLEGVPLTVYGDSQAKNPSQGADTGTQFSDRLNGRQRFRSYDNRGVAGTNMGEIASAVSSSWVANSRGLVLVCSGIGNTSTQWGADGQASAARAFRTVMAVLSSRARFPFSSTTFAFDPSWSAGASSTANSIFDVGVNGNTAYLLVNTATGVGGVIEVRDGATLVATINTGNHKAVFPGAWKITGLGSGDHILRGKLVSGSATVVGLVIPSDTPAQVAWVTVEPSRANVAQRQSYVDACAAVLADFPGAVRVTPAPDWDPLQHISDEDGLHLNDRGNAYMADRTEAVLATLEFSQGLNRLTRSTAASAYVGPTPAPIIVVTTYAADSFDRPNGALGTTEVGNRAWALSVASSVNIVDNAAEWATASATAGTIAYIDDGQSLGKVTAEGIVGATYGLFAFGDASLNGYYVFHSNNNGWRIGIRTPSGFTPLATAGSTTPPSSAVTVDLVRGSNGSLSAYVNGALTVTSTDSTYNGTRHGIISLVSGRRVTAWRHTDV